MHIQLSTPTQGACIERITSTFHTRVSERYGFTTLGEVRCMAEDLRSPVTATVVRTNQWAGLPSTSDGAIATNIYSRVTRKDGVASLP